MSDNQRSKASDGRWGETARRRDQLSTEGESEQPQIPPEIDESAHSQDQQSVRGVMRQAHDDVERGVQDTTRKPELDRAYEQQKGPGAQGTAPAAPDMSGAGQHKTDAGHGPGDRRSTSAGPGNPAARR
jgi:hypothetical protein